MSTPKRSQSHVVVSDNGSEDAKMKNGGNGHPTTEETKKSPVKGGKYKHFYSVSCMILVPGLPFLSKFLSICFCPV